MHVTTIYFYDPKKENGYFSNMWRGSITVKGVDYGSVEHYFQSKKFCGSAEAEKYRGEIIAAKTPAMSKVLGAQRRYGHWTWEKKLVEIADKYRDKVSLRRDWESVKDGVMYVALFAKFGEGEMRDRLLATGNAILVEDTVRDSYWGNGGDKQRIGKLGLLLMKVRSVLQIKKGVVYKAGDP